MNEENDDGVNRVGLDYRAGWIEALGAVAQAVTVEGIRAKKSQVSGLDRAREMAMKMRQDMIDKMKAK